MRTFPGVSTNTEYASDYLEETAEQNAAIRQLQQRLFMRIRKDYLGNNQLLPAYNVKVGAADE